MPLLGVYLTLLIRSIVVQVRASKKAKRAQADIAAREERLVLAENV